MPSARKPKKRINGHAKGASWERHLCRQLSLWWTEGKTDDVFWRSAGSGGMAKRRGRDSKKTYGQHGDIMAVDPIGSALIDVFTVEVKKGYDRYSPFDAIDRHDRRRLTNFENWVEQVSEACQHSGSLGWMILFQRNGKKGCVAMPAFVMAELAPKKAFPHRAELRFNGLPVAIVTMDDFFEKIKPADIKRLSGE